MDNQKQKHIKSIYRMLLEMANGNLAFRIPIDVRDDQFTDIAKSLNEIAGKIQLANYLNPHNPSTSIASETNPATVLVNKAQDYILNNLEEPLPSANELSKMFGTNEFTLKESFRTLLKTSIYQFYNDERLKKAHFLITNTTISLKEIGFMCGFNGYTNFSKAFKKKYNHSPGDLERNNNSLKC